MMMITRQAIHTIFCTLCEPYLRSEYGEEFDAKAPIKLLDKWQYGIRSSVDARFSSSSSITSLRPYLW